MITSELSNVLDFWFYAVGVNVCPADTRNKRISESWKAMQITELLDLLFSAIKNCPKCMDELNKIAGVPRRRPVDNLRHNKPTANRGVISK
jgi:hypothetical protein